MKIGLIGAGNFGFALMSHLDRKADDNLQLLLNDHREETVAYIAKHRVHPKFYPTVSLSERVELTSDLVYLITETDVLILAMVSTALEEVLQKIRPLIKKPLTIVSVMKALDDDTGKVLTEVIEEQLHDLPIKTAVLVGGTTGKELTQEQYLGMTLAAKDEQTAKELAPIFASELVQIQTSADLIGAQYASSLKNLVSLVVGIVAGLGYDHGTQTHALSLTAAECERLAVAQGAQKETFAFASQCWGNDMVMSATGQTRNRALGILLGEGLTFVQAGDKMRQEGKTAESVNTLAILNRIFDLQTYPILHWLTELTQGKTKALTILELLSTSK